MDKEPNLPTSVPWDLIERSFGAVLSREERAKLEVWTAADPEHARFVAMVRSAMASADSDVGQPDVNAIVAGTEERVRAEVVGKSKPGGRSERERSTERGVGLLGRQTLRDGVWLLGAAAMFIAAFFAFQRRSPRTPSITRSYATGVNQQGVLTLDDGTRVMLAPQTTLRLLGFSEQARTVSVDGQAYFEVRHAAGAPFEVRSGPVVTRVLGTGFLVDHAPHSSHVRIAVEDGKVRVSNTSRVAADFTITAGHVGEITDSVVTVNAVEDSASETEWLNGKLLFHHVPVATVLRTLSRWYGYRFRYADSTLPRRKVTISLSVRSAASALARLEQVLGVSLTMTGDTVTLTPQAERRAREIPRMQSYDVWTPTREVGR